MIVKVFDDMEISENFDAFVEVVLERSSSNLARQVGTCVVKQKLSPTVGLRHCASPSR